MSQPSQSTETQPPQSTPTERSGEAASPVDACALLDKEFLNETLGEVDSTFGGSLDFQDPIQQSPSAFCTWKTASSETIQLTIEPATTAETDDHSGRAYNIDEPPQVDPQDGPGTKAVLLTDTAFADVGGDGLAYGYFFVEGDLAVFVETQSFEAGAANLRAIAEEVHARLAMR